jgi:hypothetical protein
MLPASSQAIAFSRHVSSACSLLEHTPVASGTRVLADAEPTSARSSSSALATCEGHMVHA